MEVMLQCRTDAFEILRVGEMASWYLFHKVSNDYLYIKVKDSGTVNVCLLCD